MEHVQVRYASGSFKATIDTDVLDVSALQKSLTAAGYELTTSYISPRTRIKHQKEAVDRKRNELIAASALAVPLFIVGNDAHACELEHCTPIFTSYCAQHVLR
jgi:hypothetical protein